MQFSSSSTTMVTVKQSYIDNLQNKIQQHLDFCKSVEICFDKKTKDLRYKINDQHYQITTMREQLSRYKRQNEIKDQEIKHQKQIIEKQKQEILDLNVIVQHLIGDDSFEKNDCDIERNVEQDVDGDIKEEDSDEDVDGDIKEEDSDEDIDLIPSNESSDQH